MKDKTLVNYNGYHPTLAKTYMSCYVIAHHYHKDTSVKFASMRYYGNIDSLLLIEFCNDEDEFRFRISFSEEDFKKALNEFYLLPTRELKKRMMAKIKEDLHDDDI